MSSPDQPYLPSGQPYPPSGEQPPGDRPPAGACDAPAGRAVRRLRPVAHVLPALAVLVVLTLLFAAVALLFGVVFALDDAAEVDARSAASGIAQIAAVVAGVTIVCVATGLLLDRLTLRAPLAVRVPVVLVVPAVGAVLAALGVGAGLVVVEVGIVLCGYWAVFLLQDAALAVVRRVRGARRPSQEPGAYLK